MCRIDFWPKKTGRRLWAENDRMVIAWRNTLIILLTTELNRACLSRATTVSYTISWAWKSGLPRISEHLPQRCKNWLASLLILGYNFRILQQTSASNTNPLSIHEPHHTMHMHLDIGLLGSENNCYMVLAWGLNFKMKEISQWSIYYALVF